MTKSVVNRTFETPFELIAAQGRSAQADCVTFLACFLLPAGQEPELTSFNENEPPVPRPGRRELRRRGP